MSIKSCPVCLGDFESASVRKKYCSAACKDKGKPSANNGVCVVCGLAMQVKASNSETPAHNACRKEGLAPGFHGSQGAYKSGCRCGECRQAAVARVREFDREHKAEHGISYSALRKRRSKGILDQGFADCVECGEPMEKLSAGSAPLHKRCKRSYIPDYAAKRLLVLERDGLVCQLCFESVDVDTHWLSDWAVTLDHVVPRSLGGGHELENLRLAHRWCNSARRNDVSVDALLAP